jgi:Na+-driven multidrug efflux pump
MTPYLRRRTMLRIHLKYFRITVGDTLEVVKMGSPSLFRTGLATVAAIVLNKLAVGYGESALAAVSVANRVTFFIASACLGFGQGLQPVAGFSWGAQRYDRILESYRYSVRIAAIGTAVPSLLIFIFARQVLLLFTKNDWEMVAIGMFSLRVQCAAMPLHVWAIVVNMLCAGMGRARGAALLGMSRQGLCFFPILPLLIWLFGVWGVASVQGAADILTVVLVLPISLRMSRDLCRLEAERLSALQT